MSELHHGRDGWLFSFGPEGEFRRYYTDLDYFSQKDHVEQWVAVLRRRAAIFDKAQIRYLHILVPDKVSVYPDRVDLALPFITRHPVNLISLEWERQQAGSSLINPMALFAQDPDRDALYDRTGMGWTPYAAKLILREVLHAAGHPVAASGGGESLRRVYANPIATAYEDRKGRGLPAFETSINVIFRNESPDAIDEVVVIFGDSFFHFHQFSPTHLFAETFREVHFVWSHEIDYSYVARADAGLVISAQAEHSMIDVPTDEYDVEGDTWSKMQKYKENV